MRLSHRARTAVLTLATAFVAGAGADHWLQRDAHAQTVSPATVYVPPGGLLFRATDGTVLARLSRDARGGTFELFDNQQEVSMRAPRAPSAAPPLAPSPYKIDTDPFTPPASDPGY